VRGFESVGNLACNAERLIQWNRSFFNAIRQRRPAPIRETI
jgi:hypothetical protein